MKPHLEFTLADCFEYLVATAVDLEVVQQRAQNGETLTIKLGIDPTSPDIHLGRAVALWRLRAFQELGHHIVLVIGDFTAQVGDTSDKESERPMLSPAAVRANMESYEEQLWRVLNPEKKEQVTFRYNSEWLAELSFAEICDLADAFSVNQFVKRDLIAKRLQEGSRVSLREMLYPLMQGYDSVVLSNDIELGGQDQWFNLLAGRTLQERAGLKPQALIAHPIITGTDGTKMSSSKGNVISLNQEPFGLFTQMMQVPDSDLIPYLDFFPRPGRPFSAEEVQRQLADGQNPRDIKLTMAGRMVELLFGSEEATQAREKWNAEAGTNTVPQDTPDHQLHEEQYTPVSLLVEVGFASSNSEARRLLAQQAIRLNGELLTDEWQALERAQLRDQVLQAGKHRFTRLRA